MPKNALVNCTEFHLVVKSNLIGLTQRLSYKLKSIHHWNVLPKKEKILADGQETERKNKQRTEKIAKPYAWRRPVIFHLVCLHRHINTRKHLDLQDVQMTVDGDEYKLNIYRRNQTGTDSCVPMNTSTKQHTRNWGTWNFQRKSSETGGFRGWRRAPPTNPGNLYRLVTGRREALLRGRSKPVTGTGGIKE